MINKAALEIVKEFEGYRERAYKCPAGVWTIGYGHTDGVREGMRCTRLEADLWLEADLSEAERGVDYLVKVPLTENQRGALVSLAFNIGVGAFGGSTLLRYLNAGDYRKACEEFHVWNRGGGKVLPGLVRRRAVEAALFGSEPMVVDGPVLSYGRKAGANAELVKKLQRLLKGAGLYRGEVDGIPGDGTSLGVYRLLGSYLWGDVRRTMN